MAAEIVENGVDRTEQEEGQKEIKVEACYATSASKSSIRRFVITENAPTRAFSWLKVATTAFTF